jgi:hypothetical protein
MVSQPNYNQKSLNVLFSLFHLLICYCLFIFGIEILQIWHSLISAVKYLCCEFLFFIVKIFMDEIGSERTNNGFFLSLLMMQIKLKIIIHHHPLRIVIRHLCTFGSAVQFVEALLEITFWNALQSCCHCQLRFQS